MSDLVSTAIRAAEDLLREHRWCENEIYEDHKPGLSDESIGASTSPEERAYLATLRNGIDARHQEYERLRHQWLSEWTRDSLAGELESINQSEVTNLDWRSSMALLLRNAWCSSFAWLLERIDPELVFSAMAILETEADEFIGSWCNPVFTEEYRYPEDMTDETYCLRIDMNDSYQRFNFAERVSLLRRLILSLVSEEEARHMWPGLFPGVSSDYVQAWKPAEPSRLLFHNFVTTLMAATSIDDDLDDVWVHDPTEYPDDVHGGAPTWNESQWPSLRIYDDDERDLDRVDSYLAALWISKNYAPRMFDQSRARQDKLIERAWDYLLTEVRIWLLARVADDADATSVVRHRLSGAIPPQPADYLYKATLDEDNLPHPWWERLTENS